MLYAAKDLRNSFVISVNDVEYICLSVYRDTDDKHVIVTTTPLAHFPSAIIVAFSFWAAKVVDVQRKINIDFRTQRVR